MPSHTPEKLFNLALECARSGQFGESERLLRRVVAQSPQALGPLLALAQVLQSAGRAGEAIAPLSKARKLAPHRQDIAGHLAVLLQVSGRQAEALTVQRQLLAACPDDAGLWFNHALCLRDTGDIEAALESCGKVLALNHNDIECLAVLADLQIRLGLLADACATAERAFALAPDVPGVLQVHGLALLKAGRPADAVASLARQCALQPASAEARSNLALALVGARRYREALDAFDTALSLAPDQPDIWFNRGVALLALRRYREAAEAYRQTLSLSPGYLPAQLDLLLALHGLGQDDAVLAESTRLLALDGQARLNDQDRASVLLAASQALSTQGAFDRAEDCLQQARQLAPDRAEVVMNLSLIDLRNGHLRQGWLGYESRWDCNDNEPRQHADLPQLQTLQHAAGRHVLVWSEQGLGDTVQFCRYLALLTQVGATVTLEAQGALATLLSSLPWKVRVITRGEAIGPVDYQLPVMSLPGLVGTEIDSIPADLPYLQADPRLVAVWRKRCPPSSDGRPNIGLAFSGNPLHANDRYRSASLAACLPLADIAHVHLLQTGLSAEDRALLGSRPDIQFHGDTLADFADTAAAASAMDLILSVDTSLAHVCGALGLPVWLLLPSVADWRWSPSLGETRSPWYPGMRLWRQQTAGGWSELIGRISRALQTWKTDNLG